MPPYSRSHSQTRASNASRPRSCRVFPSLCEVLLDRVLGRDPRVVEAGLEEDVVALHPARAHDRVGERELERVTQVQVAGHVRRRVRDRRSSRASGPGRRCSDPPPPRSAASVPRRPAACREGPSSRAILASRRECNSGTLRSRGGCSQSLTADGVALHAARIRRRPQLAVVLATAGHAAERPCRRATVTSWPRARSSSIPAASHLPSSASEPRRPAAGQKDEISGRCGISGASIASCRFSPRSTWRGRRGTPTGPAGPRPACRSASHGLPSRRARPGESVVRGRLPGREGRAAAPLQPEHLRARPERPAERRDGRRGVQPAAARRGRDDVPQAVGDVDVHGVAACRLSCTGRGCRRVHGRQPPEAGLVARTTPRLSPGIGARRCTHATAGCRAGRRRRRTAHRGRRTRASRTRSRRGRTRRSDIAARSKPSSSASCWRKPPAPPPRPRLADRVAGVVVGAGRLQRRVPARQVVAGQQPAVPRR